MSFPTSYESAAQEWADAMTSRRRDTVKLANNTYLEAYRLGDGFGRAPDGTLVPHENPAPLTYAVRLHRTNVVTWYPNGSIKIDDGGWASNVSQDRIRQCGVYVSRVSEILHVRPYRHAPGNAELREAMMAADLMAVPSGGLTFDSEGFHDKEVNTETETLAERAEERREHARMSRWKIAHRFTRGVTIEETGYGNLRVRYRYTGPDETPAELLSHLHAARRDGAKVLRAATHEVIRQMRSTLVERAAVCFHPYRQLSRHIALEQNARGALRMVWRAPIGCIIGEVSSAGMLGNERECIREMLESLQTKRAHVPHYADDGAAIGWRAWKVDPDGTLVSPQQNTRWETPVMSVPTWSDREAHRGAAGIHAVWGMRRNQMPRNDSYATSGTVSGLVRGFGRIVTGEDGFRAERAIIDEIHLGADMAHRAEQIRTRYPSIIVKVTD